MLVFWQPKLVFLATPKTGTTAITAALESLAAVSITQPPALKHTNVRHYHQFLHPYLEAASGGPFTVVALIREPRDWLGSWYRFRQSDSILASEQSTAGISFDDFVQAYCSTARPEFANVGSQADFLDHGTGKWVDHLFRYADIAGFLRFLEDRLDCEILLPHLNVSPPGPLELSAPTDDLLQRFAAKDFAMYHSLQPLGA
jgi:hypothetical protein